MPVTVTVQGHGTTVIVTWALRPGQARVTVAGLRDVTVTVATVTHSRRHGDRDGHAPGTQAGIVRPGDARPG